MAASGLGRANHHRMWRIGRDRSLDLAEPRLMAILNATPDSFFDGSRVGDVASAVERADGFVREGAAMLDIGGESTRPGSAAVSVEEQIERTLPIIRAIRSAGGALRRIPISIDTTRSEVAEAALDGGADVVNDVSAGRDDPAMLELVGSRGAGLILMHRVRPASEDAYSDRYERPPMEGDVVAHVRRFLKERALAAMEAGVEREAIVLDPGLGFGKSVEQNLELIRRTGELADLGYPVLSGLSRKSFVGRVQTGGGESDAGERLAGTLAMSLMHVMAGARLLRVHDVGEHGGAIRAGIAAGLLGGLTRMESGPAGQDAG